MFRSSQPYAVLIGWLFYYYWTKPQWDLRMIHPAWSFFNIHLIFQLQSDHVEIASYPPHITDQIGCVGVFSVPFHFEWWNSNWQQSFSQSFPSSMLIKHRTAACSQSLPEVRQRSRFSMVERSNYSKSSFPFNEEHFFVLCTWMCKVVFVLRKECFQISNHRKKKKKWSHYL